MEWRNEIRILFWMTTIFLAAYFLPTETMRFQEAISAMFDLAKWYAQEHVILCLIPAFFIAGVISIFVSEGSVIKYFGAGANKLISYTIASISGTILAVCSCTILPLFTSIYKRGAGLGPAIAFLYSGPAINILAIILTARILGWQLGIARVIGAVLFSVIIGAIMSLIYRKEEIQKRKDQLNFPIIPEKRPLWQTSLLFFTLVFILVFANWGSSNSNDTQSIWYWLYNYKWYLTSFFSLILAYSLISILKIKWYWVSIATMLIILISLIFKNPLVSTILGIASLSVLTLFDKNEEDNKEWALSSWGFAKQIMPLLALGVLAAGFLLGSTHNDVSISGIIPNQWIIQLVGGNSFFSNMFASLAGALMYFATLTEVPILQGLIGAGMGKGPALALLLAGPSLSIPNILVIRSIIGTQKTLVFVSLVVTMASLSGMLFGFFF